jgi:hypothetical protein|tara:strand:+ start:2375 stop:2521 length:147 start_codon:yes stop_codon:yes gene_type:complete
MKSTLLNDAPHAKLIELSKQRKANKHPYRTMQEVLEQLIEAAHKKECK